MLEYVEDLIREIVITMSASGKATWLLCLQEISQSGSKVSIGMT